MLKISGTDYPCLSTSYFSITHYSYAVSLIYDLLGEKINMRGLDKKRPYKQYYLNTIISKGSVDKEISIVSFKKVKPDKKIMLLLNIYHTYDSYISDVEGPLHAVLFKSLIVKNLFTIREKLYFIFDQKYDEVNGTHTSKDL